MDRSLSPSSATDGGHLLLWVCECLVPPRRTIATEPRDCLQQSATVRVLSVDVGTHLQLRWSFLVVRHPQLPELRGSLLLQKRLNRLSSSLK